MILTLKNSKKKKKMFLKHQRMFYRSLLAEAIIFWYKKCGLSSNTKLISIHALHRYSMIELLTVCHTFIFSIGPDYRIRVPGDEE